MSEEFITKSSTKFLFSSSAHKECFTKLFTGELSITRVGEDGVFSGRIHSGVATNGIRNDLNAPQELVPGTDGILPSNTKPIMMDFGTTRNTDDTKQPSEQQNGQQKQMHTSMEAINHMAQFSSDMLSEAKSSSEFSVVLNDEELHFAYGVPQDMGTQSNTESSQFQSNEIFLSNVTVTITNSSARLAMSNIKSSNISTGMALTEKETRDGALTTQPSEVKQVVKLSKKRIHTLYSILHGIEVPVCKFYKTMKECHAHFDEEFASGFEKFLSDSPATAQAAANNDDNQNDDMKYHLYIVHHLRHKMCPSTCDQLWKYCIARKQYSLLQFADAGLLIHSEIRPGKVGGICNDYLKYKDFTFIGRGGFGIVYRYVSESGPQLALKVENKHPLITGGCRLFERILRLEHKHVINVLEYIVGPCGKNNRRLFLFVMPFKNQRGLDAQFNREDCDCKCVLDYMRVYQDKKDFVFRNFTVLFRHVFEGLSYLEGQKIVHRDIKSSNILVHKNCQCVGPLLCTCPGDGEVLYVLGDLDLLCLEEDCSSDMWDRMVQRDPAGTEGFKPPESFFKSDQGGVVINHKSDVWSGCVTMTNVLVGKEANSELQNQISEFLKATNKCAKDASHGINQSSVLLEKIVEKVVFIQTEVKEKHSLLSAENETSATDSELSGLINNEMDSIRASLEKLKMLLGVGIVSLERMRSFQGVEEYKIYKEENPLARILTSVYGAKILYWRCLSQLPDIYKTPLWIVMKRTIKVIDSGVQFMPDNRKTANEVIESLKTVYPS